MIRAHSDFAPQVSNGEALVPTQADRDAAADACNAFRFNDAWASSCRGGHQDDSLLVQAFARHAASARKHGREEAAKVADDISRTRHWGGNIDEISAARLRICKERCAQWASAGECDGDGSCAECDHDIAVEFEDDLSVADRQCAAKIAAAIRSLTPISQDKG